MSGSQRPRRRTTTAAPETIRVGGVIPEQEHGNLEDEETNQQEEPRQGPDGEQGTGNPEILKSGRKSGNPETRKSRKQARQEPENPESYLDSVYGGTTDPDEDYQKFSTQMILYAQKALKAAAPIEQVPVQELLSDIVLGRRPPITKSHPGIVQKFRGLAERGELKR